MLPIGHSAASSTSLVAPGNPWIFSDFRSPEVDAGDALDSAPEAHRTLSARLQGVHVRISYIAWGARCPMCTNGQGKTCWVEGVGNTLTYKLPSLVQSVIVGARKGFVRTAAEMASIATCRAWTQGYGTGWIHGKAARIWHLLIWVYSQPELRIAKWTSPRLEHSEFHYR